MASSRPLKRRGFGQNNWRYVNFITRLDSISITDAVSRQQAVLSATGQGPVMLYTIVYYYTMQNL